MEARKGPVDGRYERLNILGGADTRAIVAYLIPYETLALVNGEDGPKSASTAGGVSFLGTDARLWRWGRRIHDLVLRVHRPALALDVLLGAVRRVTAFLRLFWRRRRLDTMDGR